MPYVSEAQRKYFEANRAELEAQGVKVDEWNGASVGLRLPEHVVPKSRTSTKQKAYHKDRTRTVSYKR